MMLGNAYNLAKVIKNNSLHILNYMCLKQLDMWVNFPLFKGR